MKMVRIELGRKLKISGTKTILSKYIFHTKRTANNIVSKEVNNTLILHQIHKHIIPRCACVGCYRQNEFNNALYEFEIHDFR